MSVARKLTDLHTSKNNLNTSAMDKINEIQLSIESENYAQRRTGRKGTSYYNGLAAGYRDGYRKRASEGKESPDESGNCIKPDVSNLCCPKCKSELITTNVKKTMAKCIHCAFEWAI